MRYAVLTVAALGLGALTTEAQAPVTVQSSAWADKIFKGNTGHDFGSVPRGAQLFYRFPIKNPWKVPIEIVNVRASCGCVTATPSVRLLKTNEDGFLEVSMDARRFTGLKTVTVYVTLGPQYVSTGSVQVSANSRSDVVFNPGEINFGVVAQGQTPMQTIDVEYAGTLDWRVSEVVKNGAPLDVTLEEFYRRPGQVGYHVRTALKADAPSGPFKQELFLKTNDPASPLVPLLVEASVQAPLTVVPGTVSMGVLKVGEQITKKVVVRGSKPFKITAVDGLGDGVEADLPPAAAAVQIVTLKYQPGQAGELHKQLRFKTDLDKESSATVNVEGKATP